MSSASKHSGRVSMVTGGTQGIGRAVSIELARRGDRVIFVGRDLRLGEAVLAELRRAGPSREHAFIPADLSLLRGAAHAADAVLDRTDRLDAAVFCAGILSLLPEWTEEGLERNFVLNYLSRYLLVERLLPQLLAAPSGRVVLVANAGRYPDTLDLDDLQHRKGTRGLHVAGRTQFANDLFAVDLAERMRGTTLEVTCVFPGVTRTRVFANARGLPWFVRWLAPVLQLSALSAETAAQTPVFLAHDPRAAGTSGRFYGPRLAPIEVPARARRADRPRALRLASSELIQDCLANAGVIAEVAPTQSGLHDPLQRRSSTPPL